MLVIFAATFNTAGEYHSDIPVLGLEGTAVKRVDRILEKLGGKRTRFERSKQPCPSVFFAGHLQGKELRVRFPPKVLVR